MEQIARGKSPVDSAKIEVRDKSIGFAPDCFRLLSAPSKKAKQVQEQIDKVQIQLQR